VAKRLGPAGLPKSMTILVDSREQIPFLFPKKIIYYAWRRSENAQEIQLDTEVVRMDFADYAMKSHEDCCALERKRNLDELSKNILSKDYRRAHSAFSRLVLNCRHPYIVLDGDLDTYAGSQGHYSQAPTELILDGILSEATLLGIPIICTGGATEPEKRRRVGAYLVHLMLNHIVADRLPPSPTEMLEKLRKG